MRTRPSCPRTVTGFALALALALTGCGGTQPAPEAAPEKPAPKATPAPDPRYAALPEPTAAPEWTPPEVHKSELKNGMWLWHMESSAAPLVSIHLVLPTGSVSDPKGKDGLTLLSADLLDEGAGKLNALELSDRLGTLATDYSASAGVDYVLLTMEALAENFEESLALLGDIVQRPKLSRDEFERRKQHHLANALSSQDDPEAARGRALSRVLFGEGYAGAPPEGTTKTLTSITYQDVKTHLGKIVKPKGAHLIVAGMTDQARALRAVEQVFGSFSGKPPAVNVPLAPAPPGGVAYVIPFEGASQSALGVAVRTPGDDAGPFFAEEVMNEKLGGSFTGRINLNLREDKGYTYGAFAMYRRYKKAGYYAVLSNVKTEATAMSVTEILNELSAPCKDRAFSEQERQESILGLLLGYPMNFDEVGSVGLRLASLPIHDRPENYWTEWPEAIRQVDLTRVNAAAKPLCQTGDYSIFVAGDRTAVEGPLASLGLKLVTLDRDGHPQ